MQKKQIKAVIPIRNKTIQWFYFRIKITLISKMLSNLFHVSESLHISMNGSQIHTKGDLNILMPVCLHQYSFFYI